MKHLAILTKEYPAPGEPVYPFVEAFARAVAAQGVRVTVVAPQNILRVVKGKRPLPARAEGGGVAVLRPPYLSVGRRTLSRREFQRAALGALKELPEKPSAVYGHFIAPAGLAAAAAGRQLCIPSFLGYGESSPAQYAHLSPESLRAGLSGLRGVIAVSGKNRDELLAQNLLGADTRIGVFVNGADETVFTPRERQAARAKLGFPQDAFIVAFVGSFTHRKGAQRLSDALRTAGGVSSIFIGRGEETPTAPDMLFCGSLPHEKVPDYLAAADVFALPTLAEGCCNAVVEALLMGLPVISANLPFNDDVLGEDDALRVDPSSVPELVSALVRLRDDAALRARLAQGALDRAKGLTLCARARGILDFMEAAD